MSTAENNTNGKRKAEVEAATSEPNCAAPAKKLKKKPMKGAAKLKTKKSSTTTSCTIPNDNNPLSTFKPLTLSEIRQKIIQLSTRVPTIPPDGIPPDDKEEVKKWATQMQAVVEEFNLLLCCVSAATYKWGTDRSGAADQNLTLLSNELGNAQEQISSSVTPRLTNVLAPVVDLVTSKTVIEKNDETGIEIRTNHFSREEVDPSFLRLCSGILSRNAKMLRVVVLTHFQKIGKCIDDYVKATNNDGQNGRNAFAY